MANYSDEQIKICKKYKTIFVASPFDCIIGVSSNVGSGQMPINGLRHKPEKNTMGWYIWAGDFSNDSNFFKPMHIKHLEEKCPLILKYLGLPPGYRFQIDDKGYEDVWEDKSLLNI
jgi:hypothetical protein